MKIYKGICVILSLCLSPLILEVGAESGNASRSLTDRFNGPGLEKLQETSSGLAGVVARNKQVRGKPNSYLRQDTRVFVRGSLTSRARARFFLQENVATVVLSTLLIAEFVWLSLA